MKVRFDVLIYGASGFTGQLAVKYLRTTYPSLKWGVAGRSAAKLRDLVDSENQIVVADSSDEASLDAMTASTRVLLTFAGPFALIGSGVVASCVRSKTHYVDITGEVPWVRKMIDAYDEGAKAAKVKIVHCSGFDSIPSDIGCLHMINALRSRQLVPKEVRMIVGDSKGGASGGTIASAINIITSTPMAELQKLGNPFYLAPRDAATGEPTGPADSSASTDAAAPGYDDVFKTYTAPWLMQGVNTRIVNMSNAKRGWDWGKDFVYTERLKSSSLFVACVTAAAVPLFTLLLFFPPTRWLLQATVLPKQGQGPSEKLRETGFFRMKFWAKGTNKDGEEETITGGIDAFEGDPGYKQTAKMACETALCLLDGGLPPTTGVLTPASALGEPLQARLEERGINFYLD